MVRFGTIYYSQIHKSFLNPLHPDNHNKWGGTGRICGVYDGGIKLGLITELVICDGHEVRTCWHPTRGIIEGVFGKGFNDAVHLGKSLDDLVNEIRIAARSGTDKLHNRSNRDLGSA